MPQRGARGDGVRHPALQSWVRGVALLIAWNLNAHWRLAFCRLSWDSRSFCRTQSNSSWAGSSNAGGQPPLTAALAW